MRVTVVEELGSTRSSTAPAASRAHRTTSSSASARVTSVHKGDTIHVTTDPHHVHVFDTDTGERLSEDLRVTATTAGRAPHRARSAVRLMAAVKVSNSAGGTSWPMPSISSSSAPGTPPPWRGRPRRAPCGRQAVHDQRGYLHRMQPGAPVGLGDHGEHLAASRPGAHPAVERLLGPRPDLLAGLRVRRGADQPPVCSLART